MTKKQKKPTQPQFRKTCIFCGGHGLTEEHIIGQWIKRLIPTQQNHHTVFRTEVDIISDQVHVTPSRRRKQGNAATKRLKVVCAKCNNEWLSNNFENPVKPCITDMILGNDFVLSTDQQRTVALWVTKTCMVFEFDQPNRRGIPASDLKFLYDNNEVPSGFSIWIGKYDGDDTYRLRHNAWIAFSPTENPNFRLNKTDPVHANCQNTVIVVGKLLFYTISAPLNLIDKLNNTAHTDKLEQLWPLPQKDISWPSRKNIYDSDILQITGGSF